MSEIPVTTHAIDQCKNERKVLKFQHVVQFTKIFFQKKKKKSKIIVVIIVAHDQISR